MRYSEFASIYDEISGTSKRLEKADMLAPFLKKLGKEGNYEWIYLLLGKVVPDYDSREFGISIQLGLKAISFAYGIKLNDVNEKFKKIGDLGEVAEHYAEKRKQSALFSKALDVGKVFENLRKIMEIGGKGSIEKKIGIISELLGNATPREARYLIRTLLGDLRIGIAIALITDALNKAYFSGEEKELIQEAYDLTGDIALVFESSVSGKEELEKIEIVPGRPLHPMLAVKAKNIEEAFEICGKPCALEYKYDGFRLLINKYKGKISLFTRRLENVTLQFPDIVDAVEKNVKAKEFIIDGEAVGFDSKTGKYLPFESVSQRIKRKYDILELVKKLPVEVNVFDVLYLDGKSTMKMPFKERRKLLEKFVSEKKKIIKLSEFLITDSVGEAQEFYLKALSSGEEGIMVKNLEGLYQQGRRVGYMAKVKPEVRDLDLVIIGAEYGTGKRGGWLTSYIVACRSGKDFVEVGKVSSGLKEKAEEGTTYEEMTRLIRPLIIEEHESGVKIKPKLIVSVTYQNIQKSPGYSSGYALRFPRITHFRPDRGTGDIATLADIEEAARKT